MQVEYEEIAVSSDYRTIRIPLEEGDRWVEVIGTYVIPEFGSMVAHNFGCSSIISNYNV